MINEIHTILTTKNKCLDLFLEDAIKLGKGAFHTGGTQMIPTRVTLATLINIYNNTDNENNIRVQRWDLRRNSNYSLITELNDVLFIGYNELEDWKRTAAVYGISFKDSYIQLLRYLLCVDREPSILIKRLIGLFSKETNNWIKLIAQASVSEFFPLPDEHKSLIQKIFTDLNDYRDLFPIHIYKIFLSYIINNNTYTRAELEKYLIDRDTRIYIAGTFGIHERSDIIKFITILNSVARFSTLKEAIQREYNFYTILEKLHIKINKTYSKFLLFNNETKLFSKDIREIFINILTNDRNIKYIT